MIEEKRIYVVVAGTVQVPASRRSVIQPPGRQIAQACHVTSKLRHEIGLTTINTVPVYDDITTIVLLARDSAELGHVFSLAHKRKLRPVLFSDTNESAYGPGRIVTALAVYATKKQIENILDYLPLWGS